MSSEFCKLSVEIARIFLPIVNPAITPPANGMELLDGLDPLGLGLPPFCEELLY